MGSLSSCIKRVVYGVILSNTIQRCGGRAGNSRIGRCVNLDLCWLMKAILLLKLLPLESGPALYCVPK